VQVLYEVVQSKHAVVSSISPYRPALIKYQYTTCSSACAKYIYPRRTNSAHNPLILLFKYYYLTNKHCLVTAACGNVCTNKIKRSLLLDITSKLIWKIVNVKSNENVRLCMDMFNCDDVATLLTKRKQKFAGSFARMDSILCEW